ncbi:hypothetical protein [Paenibacillus jiagnxiensis]|uniref:hypothetical protein n=1 Tax=Paenibacillus jiagnxiensis TaxID=3228926 RepID=UPI0033B9A320
MIIRNLQIYSFELRGLTNASSKLTEDIVTWNRDREAELQAKARLLELAMSRLSSVQRSYLDEEGESDAIGILAASLNLIVMTNKMPDKICG